MKGQIPMKLSQIQELLNATILTQTEWKDIDVHSAFGCDLMSDVLAFVKDQSLLLTGLINPQVVRTAEMLDINVIVFVRGKKPTPEMIDLATKLNMIIMCTENSLYTSSGLLYSAGLAGNGE